MASDLNSSQERWFRYVLKQSKRAVLYLLAIIGALGIGCLSGLPAATCYALADAYTIALQKISFLPFLAILWFLMISAAEKVPSSEVIGTRLKRILFGIAGLLFIVIIVTTIGFLKSGADNIRLAVDHCLKDTPSTEPHLHNKIPLSRF